MSLVTPWAETIGANKTTTSFHHHVFRSSYDVHASERCPETDKEFLHLQPFEEGLRIQWPPAIEHWILIEISGRLPHRKYQRISTVQSGGRDILSEDIKQVGGILAFRKRSECVWYCCIWGSYPTERIRESHIFLRPWTCTDGFYSLSITEWRPVTGSLPPRSAKDWAAEFSKYRSSPEFKLLNPHMTLDEFKSIYYMEWAHRLWGRVVGVSFLLPAAYFIARRKVSAPMAGKIVGIAGLIGFQGFLGWWMVKSGLKDDLFAPGSHPRVSQYRLTAHLGTAFVCYTAMLWNGLSILREHKLLADPQAAMKLFERLKSPELRIFRRSVGALAVLVFCTAMSGGLVAGLDAGLIYNEFPYMGLGLTPPKSELFSDFYSHTPDKSDIWWRNALENPSLVQLDHRILATTTFTSVMGLWAYTKFSPTLRTMLPIACKKGMHGVVGFVGLQVALGITTLLYLVPLPLASAHQAGSLALLSSVIILGGRTWVPRRAARLVAKRLSTTRPAVPSTISTST
ncbi:MAG: hypothetical protein L6R40_003699 [Gallowayella cf. fulva]|nr:MAG: hypothetical protein L6R40_003699 [Xanthomendoza cf. fulva]